MLSIHQGIKLAEGMVGPIPWQERGVRCRSPGERAAAATEESALGKGLANTSYAQSPPAAGGDYTESALRELKEKVKKRKRRYFSTPAKPRANQTRGMVSMDGLSLNTDVGTLCCPAAQQPRVSAEPLRPTRLCRTRYRPTWNSQ